MLRPIVELVGIAGSGKTTLTNLVAERLESSGTRTWTNRKISDRYLRAKRLFQAAARIPVAGRPIGSLNAALISRRRQRILGSFQSEHPIGWAHAEARLASIDQSSPEEAVTLRRFIERHAFLFGAHHLYAEPDRVLVADEGIAQRAVNLFAVRSGETQAREAAEFLEHWAMPDIVVFVAASLDLCEARILERGLPTRLRGRPQQDVAAFLRSSEVIVDEIRRAAIRRQVPVIPVTNGATLAELHAVAVGCSNEVARLVAN